MPYSLNWIIRPPKCFGRQITSSTALFSTFSEGNNKSSKTNIKPLEDIVKNENANISIILVHGAFADGSSWNKVIPILEGQGFTVTAVQNPLKTLAEDVATTKRAIESQKSENVILVGHSYGGAVITEAAAENPKVKALVYVAAFAPDAGRSGWRIDREIFAGSIGDCRRSRFSWFPFSSTAKNFTWFLQATCLSRKLRCWQPLKNPWLPAFWRTNQGCRLEVNPLMVRCLHPGRRNQPRLGEIYGEANEC